jgi:hypothetical protein
VPGRQHHSHVFLAETNRRHWCQFRQRVVRGGQSVGQGEVQVSPRRSDGYLLPGRGRDREHQTRHPGSERCQRLGEGRPSARQRGDADRQGGGRRCRQPGDVGFRRVQAQQDRLRVLQQPGARLRRGDRAAAEQLSLQVVLQRGDLLGHRSLRIPERGSGGGERAEPSHSHERPEQLRFHSYKHRLSGDKKPSLALN